MAEIVSPWPRRTVSPLAEIGVSMVPHTFAAALPMLSLTLVFDGGGGGGEGGGEGDSEGGGGEGGGEGEGDGEQLQHLLMFYVIDTAVYRLLFSSQHLPTYLSEPTVRIHAHTFTHSQTHTH
jgi:hypothetical protein